MEEKRCVACGYDGPALDRHHIHGRKNSDKTVFLCANCHREQHCYSLILVENKASKAALKEMDDLVRQGVILNYKAKMEILKKHNYEGYWDGEKEVMQEYWNYLKARGSI